MRCGCQRDRIVKSRKILNKIVRASPPADMDSRKPEVPVLQSLFSYLRFDNRDKIEDKNFKILEWNGCLMKHLIIGSSIFIEIH